MASAVAPPGSGIGALASTSRVPEASALVVPFSRPTAAVTSLTSGVTLIDSGSTGTVPSASAAPSSSGRVAGRVARPRVLPAPGWTAVTASSAPCGAASVGGLASRRPGWTAWVRAGTAEGEEAAGAGAGAEDAAGADRTAVPAAGS